MPNFKVGDHVILDSVDAGFRGVGLVKTIGAPAARGGTVWVRVIVVHIEEAYANCNVGEGDEALVKDYQISQGFPTLVRAMAAL